ncbi:DUF4886 domain-containing protein [Rufibacter roseus]|uniref:DUF4886 domain-containing protein n=1 Tax=Rufibacter roseus TaxID=1567108 RepID=A0ABW2DQ17_9BACT|nr:DUF4886 domain-containing protein [Rufibacter roseus]
MSALKSIFPLFFFVAFLLNNAFGFSSSAELLESKKAKGKVVRLFIIGNSFSQNASRFLPQLAKEKGHELILGRAEIGGASLQRHWDTVVAHEADPKDPKGNAYGGKSLKVLLSEGEWDIVTIQQNSMNTPWLDTYQPYARNLYEFIKKLQPNAEVILHQTWAYRADAKVFGLVADKEHAKDQKEMWEKSRANYHAIAKELDLRLLPVGDAFWQVSSDKKWGYKKDPNYDFNNPAHPAMPNQANSLHAGYRWHNKNLIFDANHANVAGEFLGSLVWYGVLFNESPTKLDFVPENVSPEFGAYLKKVAKKEVKKSKKYSFGKIARS